MLDQTRISNDERAEAIMIYADFNGIESYQPGSDKLRLNLTGYGTLASLSSARLRLEVGKVINFHDSEGLCLAGRVSFDPAMVAPNCSGWFAYFEKSDMRESIVIEHDFKAHLCFECRVDIRPHLDKVGRHYDEICPFCGTPVMFPLSPPPLTDRK